MADLIQKKIEGEVGFVWVQGSRFQVIAKFPALIHLFEHDYDPQTKFWYGVADVSCNVPDIIAAAKRAGMPQPPGLLYDAIDFTLRIEIEGRFGLAKAMNSHFTADSQSELMK